jgi:hypothetical protein
MTDMAGEVGRRRRKSVLRTLWTVALLLVAGQAGAAIYLYRERAQAIEHGQNAITEARVANQLKVARTLLDEGKVEAAEVHLEGLLARKPGHVETMRLLAQVRKLRSKAPSGHADAAPIAAASRPAEDARTLDGGWSDGAADAARDTRPPRAVAKVHRRRDGSDSKDRSDRKGRKDQPATTETPPEAKPGVRDLTLPRKLLGNADRGERILRMGCGLCHGRTTGKVVPTKYSAKGWARYFASGAHGRHNLLRSNFRRSELADVKAFLVSKSKSGK